MKLSYRYRFYPTEAQARHLARTFGCCRYVYNWALETWTTAYRERGENLSESDLSRGLPALKRRPETTWLADVSSITLQQSVRNFGRAQRAFLEKRSGYPSFKRRSSRQSASYTLRAFRYSVEDGVPALQLAKMDEPLRVRWSRPLPAEPSSLTIVRDRAGRYFVSLICEAPRREAPQAERAAVGVDLGLTHFAILSTGEKVENPRHMEQDLKALHRAQKSLSRKQKGSANREKARRRVAKIHARIRDRRADFLHKLSTRLIRENQAVCVESLNVEAMVKNRRLARHIGQAGWGEFVRLLDYKAELYGREVVRCGRFEPTSKRCSGCGHVCESLDLGTRRWRCAECGEDHDRDVNAAKNILAAGLAVSASGDGVSPRVPLAPPVAVCEGGTSQGGETNASM